MKLPGFLYEGSSRLYFKDWVHWSAWIVGGSAAVAAALGVLLGGGVAIDRHLSERNCARFAAQTDYVTEFKSISWMDYGCYVQTNEGWVLRDRVVGVEL